ncbi:MAG: M23 family metallopeptidase [Pseudomonadota bacterium]
MKNASSLWRERAPLCAVCLFLMCSVVVWNCLRPAGPRGGLAAADYRDALERKVDAFGALRTSEYTFVPGDTLGRALAAQGLSSNETARIVDAGLQAFNVRDASPGDRLRLYRNAAGEVKQLELLGTGGAGKLAVYRTPIGFMATLAEPTCSVRLALAEGTIRTSLYADAVSEGLDGGMVKHLADVFAWDIDFLSDLQPGDSFRVVYEQQLNDIGLVRNGRILAAEVVNVGTVHSAYYFDDGEGHADYYNADGHSLRKEFLKSPMRFKHITSGFSLCRMHPILKILRPHLGVDYAAPSGTPVEAVADGRVVYRGGKSGFGNYLEIKHRHGITSTYGHLRGFAAGVRQGGLVRQGEVIGYVGATGLATGPHLDFRLAENGRWVDPEKQHGQPAEPITLAARSRFEGFITEVRSHFPTFDVGATP